MLARVIHSLAVGLTLVALTGCGAHRMAPVDVRGAGNLKPTIQDADGGMVGIASGFSPKGFDTIVVEPFVVAPGEIKDAADTRLAKDMSAYLQTHLVRKLQAAGMGIFGGDGRQFVTESMDQIVGLVSGVRIA